MVQGSFRERYDAAEKYGLGWTVEREVLPISSSGAGTATAQNVFCVAAAPTRDTSEADFRARVQYFVRQPSPQQEIGIDGALRLCPIPCLTSVWQAHAWAP